MNTKIIVCCNLMVEVLNPQPFVFHRIGNSWIKGKIDFKKSPLYTPVLSSWIYSCNEEKITYYSV